MLPLTLRAVVAAADVEIDPSAIRSSSRTWSRPIIGPDNQKGLRE